MESGWIEKGDVGKGHGDGDEAGGGVEVWAAGFVKEAGSGAGAGDDAGEEAESWAGAEFGTADVALEDEAADIVAIADVVVDEAGQNGAVDVIELGDTAESEDVGVHGVVDESVIEFENVAALQGDFVPVG